jgi:hypothetical protein
MGNQNLFSLLNMIKKKLRTSSGLRSLEVAFPPHDSSDAGSNPTEVVEILRTEKFREQVLREGL